MKKCGNCERNIGNLESTHTFNGALVCSKCNDILNQGKIDTAETVNVKSGHVTIEKTAKRWKGQRLLGSLLVIVGIIWTGCANSLENENGAIIGAVMGITGLIVYIHSRISAWWHHG